MTYGDPECRSSSAVVLNSASLILLWDLLIRILSIIRAVEYYFSTQSKPAISKVINLRGTKFAESVL